MIAQNSGRDKPCPAPGTSNPIYVSTRVVGHVTGDTFHKTVRASTHLLQKPRGWASDVSALHDALAVGATYIEIHDTESGAKYRTSIEAMLKQGVELNRGYGRQIVLPIKGWRRVDLGQGQQLHLFAMEADR